MSSQKISRIRLLLALLIAIFIFVNIFLFTYTISFLKSQKISEIESDIRYSLLSFNVERELLKSCDDKVLDIISKDLDEVGSIVSILEENFGKDDKKVLEQKRLYTLMEVQHFLNIKEYNEDCDKNKHTFLFFYSNQNPFDVEAERVGKILNTLKSKNKDVMIYSFDYDLDFQIIDLLKSLYNVSAPNVVVINEKGPFTINHIDDLDKHLE